jgi:hypothetical protein
MRIAFLGGMILLAVVAIAVKFFRDYSTAPEAYRMRHSAWRYAEGGVAARTPWWFYPVFGLGGLILFFWFLSRVYYGYEAATLLDTSAKATAAVTQSGMPREESHYAFEVDGHKYTGRGANNLAAGKTLEILYDPNSPSTNRPADGLLFDIGTAVAVLAVMLGAIVWFVPFRRIRNYPDPQNAQVLEHLQRDDLRGAVEALNDVVNKDEEAPRVAERILASWRKDPELFDEASQSLKILEKMTVNPSIVREIQSFQNELAQVQKSWEYTQRQEGQGQRPKPDGH